MCLTLCVNTNSRILYIELQFFSFLLISHTDTSLRGKLNRIVHKIGDYLVQSVTVTNNAAFRKMRIEHQFNILLHLHLHGADNIFTEHIHVYISVGKLKCTRFNLRQVEYIRNQL